MDAVLQHLHRREYFLVTYNIKNGIFELINTSHMYPYVNIRNALRFNPVREVPTVDEALQLVVARQALLFHTEEYDSFYRSMTLCDLTSMEEDMPVITSHLMFKKGFRHLTRINRAIEANLAKIQQIKAKYARYLYSKQKCERKPLNKSLSK